MREPLPCSTIGRDFPIVIEQIVGVADFQFFRARFPIVDEHVVGAFHVVALEENEAARHGAKRIFVDAVDRFDAAGRIELQQMPARRPARISEFRASRRFSSAWASR